MPTVADSVSQAGTILQDQSVCELTRLFDAQRAAFRSSSAPTLAQRSDHIRGLVAAVMRNRKRIKDALHADFVWHPEAVADLIEILGIADRAKYVLAELPRWMADDVRPIDSQIWGSGQAVVRYQPKGVIGNMIPWNFPFDIAFGPLIEMLAAGNRVILKPSDLGPASAAAIVEIVREAFDETHVGVVTGGLELAEAFSALPWDHLMFTGSPAVGRHVMAAAAKNLTPVTLELGGKCPAILSYDSIDVATVGNIVGMKLLKSGQVCVAPDHVFVPHDRIEDFMTLVSAHVANELTQHTDSKDATGIITSRHFDRLIGLIDEARAAGSVVVQPESGAAIDRNARQLPFTVIVDPDPQLRVMTEEIFGPILPIIPYVSIEEVIRKVNAGERPLAIYVYAQDPAFSNNLLARTTSGGGCVNLSVLHGAIPTLPFGGIGNSGMGRHHGIEGFREFSNPRGLFIRGDGGAIDAFCPPYRTLDAIVEHAFGDSGSFDANDLVT
ncbi:aldehyde dehydrogenase family protein [Sphingobium xenophagum]